MASATLTEGVIHPEPEALQVPKYLLEELEEIVEHAEIQPELIHWYHFVPCAWVRYYAYHTSPSPVESLVRRKS